MYNTFLTQNKKPFAYAYLRYVNVLYLSCSPQYDSFAAIWLAQHIYEYTIC